MPLEIPAGFGYGRFTITLSPDQDAMLTFGFRDDTVGDAAAIATALAAVPAAAGWAALLHDSMNVEKVEVKVNTGGTFFEGEAPVNLAGVDANDKFPPNVTALLRKRTGLSGRTKRGRWYWPYMNEDSCDDFGNVTPLAQATISVMGQDTLDEMTAADLPMMILHTDALEAPTPVTSLICDPVVATQRRRLR